MAMRLEDDLVVGREPPSGKRAQARLSRLVEQRRRADEKPQLAGRRHLVDVLPAGSRAPDVRERVLALRDHGAQSCSSAEGVIGAWERGASAEADLPPSRMRISRCAGGMVMPLSRNSAQIRRLTSERTLLTPSAGSPIQKRSSTSMP